MPVYLQLFTEAWRAMLGGITPIIGILLLTAIIVAVFQATFQLEDIALSLLPRTLMMIGILLLDGFGGFAAIRLLEQHWLTHLGPLVHRSWN